MKWKNVLISAVIAIAMVISGMAATSNAQVQDSQIEDLGIFYGYPSYINGAKGNVAKAVEAFKPFEVIVLGDKVEDPKHGDYVNSKQIVPQLVTNGNKVFGYVPIGTSCCGYLSIAQIKTNIDNWKILGATGIFMDEFGFDYKVTRVKQNELVDYAHNKGMKVFANAWVPVDAMGNKDENGATVNNKLGVGDYFLMEDWVADRGSLQSSKEWVTKADSALALSQKTGVKIAILATNPSPSANANSDQFKLVTNAVAMYGFGAFQWTETSHSSDSNNMNTYQLPQNYGTSIEDTVTHNNDYSIMTRKTNTGTFTIKQKGTAVSAEFKVSDVTTPQPTPTQSPSPSPTPTVPPVTPPVVVPPTVPTLPPITVPPTNNSELQKQIDALKAENAQLKNQVTNLSAENQSLKNSNDKMISAIFSIKKILE